MSGSTAGVVLGLSEGHLVWMGPWATSNAPGAPKEWLTLCSNSKLTLTSICVLEWRASQNMWKVTQSNGPVLILVQMANKASFYVLLVLAFSAAPNSNENERIPLHISETGFLPQCSVQYLLFHTVSHLKIPFRLLSAHDQRTVHPGLLISP